MSYLQALQQQNRIQNLPYNKIHRELLESLIKAFQPFEELTNLYTQDFQKQVETATQSESSLGNLLVQLQLCVVVLETNHEIYPLYIKERNIVSLAYQKLLDTWIITDVLFEELTLDSQIELLNYLHSLNL